MNTFNDDFLKNKHVNSKFASGKYIYRQCAQ